MPEPTKRMKQYGIQSQLSYILTAVSVVVLLYIGLTHINDPDEFSRNFSRLVILEAIFAITGLFFIDSFYLKTFSPYPTKETGRPLTIVSAIVFVSGLFLTEMIQLVSRIPYTISEAEVAMGIVFSAPAEEAFFRGFFLTFMYWLSDYFKLKRYVIVRYTDRKSGLETVMGASGLEVVGGFISALWFALTHVNYYGDESMILSLFLMGLLFSFLFILTKDLTGLILAHLLLNILTVAQFYLFTV